MNGKVITFYSYKGGVGRTFALASVCALLAKWQYRVLCIDWDLEAPGLGHYFRRWSEAPEADGIVEWATAFAAAGEATSLRALARRVNFPSNGGTLDFISAGRQDATYVTRAQALHWPELYDKRGLGNALERERAALVRDYDFVLIDSRTGISDLAGVCTVHLPDQLVFFFTSNDQSIGGCSTTVRRIVESRSQLPFDRERLQCVPILSRFAADKEYESSKEWMLTATKAVAPFFSGWVAPQIDAGSVLQLLRVPEIAYWTFGERIPILDDPQANSDQQSINASFHSLAALIARHLEDVGQLILARQSYLASAATKRSELLDSDGAWLEGSAEVGVGRPLLTVPVYISSASRQSLDTLHEMTRVIEAAGFTVTNSPVDESTVAGENWADLLQQQLGTARFLLVLQSGPVSSFQTAEIDSFFSLSSNRRLSSGIVPVVLEDVALDHVPRQLRRYSVVDGRRRTGTEIGELCVRALQLLIQDDADISFITADPVPR